MQNAEHDGSITLVAAPTQGVWASQLQLVGSRSLRFAGQLSTTASAHTLLAAGLISTLRTLTRAQLADLAIRAARPKAIIRVNSLDATFADALRAKITGRTGEPLRTGKNFLLELARQLARVDVRLVTEGEHRGAILALRNWATKTVLPPKLITEASSIFLPVAASAVL